MSAVQFISAVEVGMVLRNEEFDYRYCETILKGTQGEDALRVPFTEME